MPSPTRRELEKRLDDLSAPQPDERSDEPAELTESQRETCEAIVDDLNDEKRMLLGAIAKHADDSDESLPEDDKHSGLTRAEHDTLDVLTGGSGYVDRERYKEYL